VGVRVPPEDINALFTAILDLSNSPDERLRLGEIGRAYAFENWSRDLILTRFRRDLHELLTETILKSKVDWVTRDEA
jgi:hypothetical protein